MREIMKILFRLTDKNENVVYQSNKLIDVIIHIRKEINIPQNYTVEEVENNDVVMGVNAHYLIHLKKFPICLMDLF
jgi:hypothetical protein